MKKENIPVILILLGILVFLSFVAYYAIEDNKEELKNEKISFDNFFSEQCRVKCSDYTIFDSIAKPEEVKALVYKYQNKSIAMVMCACFNNEESRVIQLW